MDCYVGRFVLLASLGRGVFWIVVNKGVIPGMGITCVLG